MARIGPDEDDLADYLRYDRAATQLASEVGFARWPSRDVADVAYAQREHGVVPYDARHDSKAERQEARPAATMRIGGWHIPTYGPKAEGRGVADFDRRRR